jgi:hypothetical protein
LKVQLLLDLLEALDLLEFLAVQLVQLCLETLVVQLLLDCLETLLLLLLLEILAVQLDQLNQCALDFLVHQLVQ